MKNQFMKNQFMKIITIVLAITMCLTQYLTIYAHQFVLNIGYDYCDPPVNADGTIKSNQDGDDEMWYCIAGLNTKEKTHL